MTAYRLVEHLPKPVPVGQKEDLYVASARRLHRQIQEPSRGIRDLLDAPASIRPKLHYVAVINR